MKTDLGPLLCQDVRWRANDVGRETGNPLGDRSADALCDLALRAVGGTASNHDVAGVGASELGANPYWARRLPEERLGESALQVAHSRSGQRERCGAQRSQLGAPRILEGVLGFL